MFIITWASDGLGLQVAKLYKEAGKKIVNISRRACPYADVNICLSLREWEQIKETTDKILEMEEPIGAIINIIGVFSNEAFGKITEDEINKLMSTNLKIPMLLTSHLFDRIQQDESDIVNVISTAGIDWKKGEPVYSASKWAERGYTKSLQTALKNTKSRVISFCPWGMKTKFFEKATWIDPTLEGSWMDPQDIALLIKNILDLPKNIEVSEIVINRK